MAIKASTTRIQTPQEFTKQQIEGISAYMRYLIQELGLTHWEILVAQDALPEGDSCHAKIYLTYGRRSGCIYFCPTFFTSEYTAEKRRYILVHELTHCLFAQQTDLVAYDLMSSGVMSRSAYNLLWEAFKRETEYLVDNVATLFCKHIKTQPEFES